MHPTYWPRKLSFTNETSCVNANTRHDIFTLMAVGLGLRARMVRGVIGGFVVNT